MSFILRQFQEGDRFFSVQGVGNTAGVDCWVDDVGNYKDSFLIVEVNGVSHPILTSNVISLGLGYFYFTLPSTSGLISAKSNTTLKLKSKCSTDVSDVKTALPIDFNLSVPSNVFVCNEQVNLIPSFKDRVRLFFGTTTPNNDDIVELFLNDSPFNRTDAFLEQGYTNNVDSNVAGKWSEVLHSGNSVYWSNLLYTPNNDLYIKPNSLNYFTVRLGYLELVFDGVKVVLINYLNAIQTDLGTYGLIDDFRILSTSNEYQIVKNNLTIQRIGKTLNFSVSGGTLSTNVATAGAIVTWNLPNTGGNYDFNTYFNEVFLTKTITLQNCVEQSCELRHKLDGFAIKCCSEGQAEIYRNHIRVGVVDLNILGEGTYKTKLDGYYQIRTKCNNIWGELSPYQYFSFYDNCKPKTDCGCNDVTPTSASYLTSETAKGIYVAKTGTTELSGSLIPNVTNTVNLGSDAFPINKTITNEVGVTNIRAKDNTGIHFYDVTGGIELGRIKSTGHIFQIGAAVTTDTQTPFTQLVINHNGQGASGIQFNTDVTGEVVALRNINGDADLLAQNNVRITSGLTSSTIFTAGNEVQALKINEYGEVGVVGEPSRFHYLTIGNSSTPTPHEAGTQLKIANDMGAGSGIQLEGDAIGKAAVIQNINGSLSFVNYEGKAFFTGQGVVVPQRTVTQAAVTPVRGQILYVTNTDGTFTSTGFWGYTGSTWVKFH